MNSLISVDKQYVANTYNRFPVEIVSGKGSRVVDTNGKEYIDMGSGIGVTAFGLADDVWANAVAKQASTLQHMSNLYYTEPCALLAKALCEKTGLKKVFFSNSGAEANECAIKVARKWAAENKGEDCYTIVTLQNSFHGRTLTTLAATGQEHFHKLFKPLTNGFIHTPANDIDALKKTVSENNIAAVMFECVQGEGGVIALDPDFVKAIVDLSKEYNFLVIVLPWKLFLSVIIVLYSAPFLSAAYFLATLIAHSLASAPEFEKKTFFIPVLAHKISAS